MDKCSVKPMDGKIVIRPIEKSEEKVGGIYLPEGHSSPGAKKYAVLAVADNVNGICVGNHVLANENDCIPVKIENDLYVIIEATDVLAIID